MGTPIPYELRELTVTWTNKTSGKDIAPNSIVNQEGESLSVANGIDVSQAKSIHVEVDTTATLHVATSVDVNLFLGLQAGTRQTTRNTGVDAIVDNKIQGVAVTAGALRLFPTLDHNTGGRADVVARVLIRI